MNSLFASTGRGLEELLKSELIAMGAEECHIVSGGVHFRGDDALLYRSLIWSRLASRILLPLSEYAVYSDLDLYLGAQVINWPEIFNHDHTFAVHFGGLNEIVRNTQYGALRIKDAIVDSFTRKNLPRPNVDREHPDVRINVWLNKEQVSIAFDLSGDALHQRGYRDQTGGAPLKENLAAAIVLRSGWQQGSPLIDPLCGSGTLLIEAALMACDQAPGLQRSSWGAFSWTQFNQKLWDEVMDEACERAKVGLHNNQSHFYGYDNDSRVIKYAQANARRAGVAQLVTFQTEDISQLKNPLPAEVKGTVLSNPPYGERLESEPALIALHSQLGRIMKQQFPGWRLSLISASTALLSCLQLRAERQFKAKNGPLDCVQKNYLLADISSQAISAGVAEDYANRLRKNLRHREKWARQQGINCYRIYDADLPEYNVAVDRYDDWVVIQEYAPPKTIDAQKARQRVFDIISATLQVMAIPASQLVLKTREKQKGKNQYQKLAEKGRFIEVCEYEAHLLVNLTDYLDTGLFLDHRIARQMLGRMSQGKDFLNLFGYTGSASVHAGIGGARSTTTVDMSRTYLEWAERNLRLNHLTGRQHRLIQADCLSWLTDTAEQFDVIFIDPPTFSNSKRMSDDFDVQRDHVRVFSALKRLLRPRGTIMFSNNKRGFKMDHEALDVLGLSASDITAKTQSEDFSRNRHIHNCWLVTHTGKE